MTAERLTIGIVGLGVIGLRWAACFSHAGYRVQAFDPASDTRQRVEEALPFLRRDLDALNGARSQAGSVEIFPTLGEALNGAAFVQESGPEDLEQKQALLAEIEKHVDGDVVIASSSSALLVSDMQSGCRLPGRVVLGHPFNPVHIMPLVEVVGGNKTDSASIERAYALYEMIGKKPVMLNQEVTGHLALRLMAAMWREAIALVRDGVASVADIDRAFIYGPGAKWTLQGSFISNGLNAGGLEDFLRKYGPTYQAIWDTLRDADLDERTVSILGASTSAALDGRTWADLRAARDEGLVPVLRAVSEHGAL